ncbi:MAG TPA: spermidine/putrescine ABC transporter substrate-binding protein [Acidimicrobiia bacterium]|nr:spermidine/putrescine ABC transporter substrate-binding protein [Acidimicrobiia bacterium]
MTNDDTTRTDLNEVEKALAASLNRRDFLKSAGLIFGGLAISPALLAACTSDSGNKSSAQSIHISNWTSYIGESQKKDFEKATGIKLTYTEDVNDNSEYFAKIQPQLNRNKSINRDGFILTDWMANRIINQVKWAQPLSTKKFPNKKNLVDTLASPSFDETRKYSVPWASIIAGIAYNIKLTGKEIKTFDDFLNVSGSKTVLSEMRDTIGIMLMDSGVKIESADFSSTEKEFDRLQELLDSKKIDGVNGNDYVTDLSSGNLAACFAWSGDVAQIARDNPDVRFVIPESGGTISSDNFMIPISSDKPDLATEFINYFYDPAVSAQWVSEVQYISPVQGITEELTKLGGDAAKLVDDPLVVPDEDVLKQLQIFAALSEKDEEEFDKRSADIVGAG